MAEPRATVGLAASDDVFAVEADFYVPPVASGTILGVIDLFTHNQVLVPCQNMGGMRVGPWVRPGAGTSMEWWTVPLTTCGSTQQKATSISSVTGAWKHLRVEGARSTCRFVASLDGVVTDTWTQPACSLPGAYFGMESNWSVIQAVNVAWSNMRISKGTPGCVPGVP